MAEPKRKISKQRGRTRFANWKLSAPNLVECSNCHQMIQSHRVCPHCGYYDGKLVKEPKPEKTEE